MSSATRNFGTKVVRGKSRSYDQYDDEEKHIGRIYPVDDYFNHFAEVAAFASDYHLLWMPLLGQHYLPGDMPGDLCGRTSPSMVYNWHVLAQGGPDVGARVPAADGVSHPTPSTTTLSEALDPPSATLPFVTAPTKAGNVMPPRLSALIFILCASLAAAAEPPVLYIQGSEVNLRAFPIASADISAKVPIATECVEVTPKPPDKAWVKLKCGEAVGHTLRSLVSNQKPDFDSLLERATNARLGPQARYDSGLRALALRLDSTEAAEAVRTAFFDLQFRELMQLPDYARAWKSGMTSEYVLAPDLNVDTPAPDARPSTLIGGFIYGCDWNDLKTRGRNRFVYLARRLGRLHVVLGAFRPGQGPGGSPMADAYAYKEFDLGKTLETALLRHGCACDSPSVPAKGPYWLVSPEDANLVGSLPAEWYDLRGEPGHRERIAYCRGVREPPRAAHLLGLNMDRSDSSETLTAVLKDGNHLTFRVRDSRGSENETTIEWLVDEPGVAVIDGHLSVAKHLGENIPFVCEKEPRSTVDQSRENAR